MLYQLSYRRARGDDTRRRTGGRVPRRSPRTSDARQASGGPAARGTLGACPRRHGRGTTLDGVRRALSRCWRPFSAWRSSLCSPSGSRAREQPLARRRRSRSCTARRPRCRRCRCCRPRGRQSLAAYRGQVVVLNFWASWCDPCQAEAPMLERTAAPCSPAAARPCSASPTRTPARIRRPSSIATDSPIPSCATSTASFAHAYGTDQLPETFVIDRRGRVVAISSRRDHPAFLSRALSVAQRS